MPPVQMNLFGKAVAKIARGKAASKTAAKKAGAKTAAKKGQQKALQAESSAAKTAAISATEVAEYVREKEAAAKSRKLVATELAAGNCKSCAHNLISALHTNTPQVTSCLL